MLAVTGLAAATVASLITWSVLNDQSSTAALGVLTPAVVGAAFAGLGMLVSASFDAVRSRTRT